MSRAVAITGAGGYLGSLLTAAFRAEGSEVVPLVRNVDEVGGAARPFDLMTATSCDVLSGVDVLVHCAYDLRITSKQEIMDINVGGSRSLLEAARSAAVGRIITVSSMSAFPGTTQLYGMAKLLIEEATFAVGGVVVRPGLVVGAAPGGMAGALRKLTRLPLTPIIAGATRQFPVHADDLCRIVVALANSGDVPTEPLGIAQSEPTTVRALMSVLAEQDGRRCRWLPVPPRLVFLLLRLGERLHLPLPFRSDSLRGLLHTASEVPGTDALRALGIPSPRRVA